MKYHVAFGRSIDLEAVHRDAEAHKCPRNGTAALAARLGATIHQPGTDVIRSSDRRWTKLAGSPEHWALARRLADQLTADDLIFCSGEDVGIPIATVCGDRRNRRDRPKVAVFMHNIARPRGYLAYQWFRLADRIDLFVTNARPQADFLHQTLRIPESRIYVLPEHIDTAFFTPGAPTLHKVRPMIVSVGLEKRDYRTVATATENLAVDVKISGFSKDARTIAQAFPETLPANMTRQFYEWPDLVQLYRDADVVVVSLVDNKFCAGLTAMLEAMSCHRPVIITRTQGLTDYLTDSGISTVIDSGDPAAMRQAIVQRLANPQAAQIQAQMGYEQVLKFHTMERYVDNFADRLRAV